MKNFQEKKSLTYSNTLLSIIICVYKTEDKLKKCLESVFNQSYKNFEIILVNDYSNKKLILKILKKFDKNKIFLINNEKNMGLFQSRIIGVKNSHGNVIAFLDSDDFVTSDFYRKNIFKMIQDNSDIVFGEFLEYQEEQNKYYKNKNFIKKSEPIENEKILDYFFSQKMLDFSWHVVWNKVYKRDVVWKAIISLQKFTSCINMCEDLLFSIYFFTNAKKLSFSFDDYYIYVKHKSNMTSNRDSKIFQKNINDILLIFNFLGKNLDKRMNEKLIFFKCRLAKIYSDMLYSKKINNKNYFENLIRKIFDIDKQENKKYLMHFSHEQYINEKIEFKNFDLLKNKELICNDNIKYIYFDIFDILVLKPFYKHSDIFIYMNQYLNNYKKINYINDFSYERIKAENMIIEKTNSENIDIEKIYENLKQNLQINENLKNKLINLEKKLEINFSYERKIGKELYELSLYLKKKIFFINNSYIDEKTINKILLKNGYGKNYFIPILKESNIKSNNQDYKSSALYITSRLNENAKFSKNLINFYLPKTIDIFENKTQIARNEYFNFINKNNSISDKKSLWNFFTTRSLLAIAINKIYDNPYLILDDFLYSPKNFGYFALGLNLFSIIFWLKNQIEINGIKNLVFDYRDGYLIKKGFELLNKNIFKLDIKVQKSYFSKDSLLCFLFKDKYTIKYLPYFINDKNIKYDFLRNFLKNVLPTKKIKILDSEYSDSEINGTNELIKFVNFCIDNSIYLDKNKLSIDDFKIKYFKKIFLKNGNYVFNINCSKTSIMLNNFFRTSTNELYIYVDDDNIYDKFKKNNKKIHTFYNFKPNVADELRWCLLSLWTKNKCIGFQKVNNQYIEIWNQANEDFITSCIVENFQSESINFLRDVVKIFNGHIKNFFFNSFDLCLPLEYYINFSNNKARFFMKELFLDSNFDLSTEATGLWKKIWDDKTKSQNFNICFDEERWNKTNSLYKFALLWIYDKKLLLTIFLNTNIGKKIKFFLNKVFKIFKK